MIDFDRFGVIEFKQTGNAAYVYPQSVFSQLLERRSQKYLPSGGEFKDTRIERSEVLRLRHGTAELLHPRR